MELCRCCMLFVYCNIMLYSCDNKGFAVDFKRSLVWKSKTLFDDEGYPFNLLLKLCPTMHPP